MLDRQPARPLCLVSCRAPATCRRRHVTETEPTTPRASHPVRTLHQTAPGDRRTPSFVCGIEKCHVGDRDRLFGSSFSTSTGHRKRNPRAALRNARALPSGASLSARETASEGAGRSQITESGQHYLTTTDRPPKPRNHCGRNPKFMTKLRFLIWPAASHHLAHTWRTPGAPLNSSSAHSCRTPVALLSHSCRTPVALLSHSCRTPVALLSHSCRTPVALLSHPVAHSWLSRCGPPSGCCCVNYKKTPTPCLWQAPASAQKTKRKTRPAIRRSARWRAKGGRPVLGSQPEG